MSLRSAIFLAAAVLLLLAGISGLLMPVGNSGRPVPTDTAEPPSASRQLPLPPEVMPEIEPGAKKFVYDISLHDAETLKTFLARLSQVSEGPQPAGSQPNVALVLHGPEVGLFALKNYSANKEMVDLAARLDAFGILEVKMCQTMMQRLGVSPGEVPAFIEQVPFGPVEVERLVGEGYVYM